MHWKQGTLSKGYALQADKLSSTEYCKKVRRRREGYAWQLKPQPAPSLHILSAVLVQTLPMDETWPALAVLYVRRAKRTAAFLGTGLCHFEILTGSLHNYSWLSVWDLSVVGAKLTKAGKCCPGH